MTELIGLIVKKALSHVLSYPFTFSIITDDLTTPLTPDFGFINLIKGFILLDTYNSLPFWLPFRIC